MEVVIREKLLAALDTLDALHRDWYPHLAAADALARTVIERHRAGVMVLGQRICQVCYCRESREIGDWPCPDYAAAVAYIEATGILNNNGD